MDFTIRRFQPGDEKYSYAEIENNDPAKGEVGKFEAIFGECLKDTGEFMHYTMERKDTLIPAGKYQYDIYYSPANKCKVPRLTKDSEGTDITSRELEHHPANYPYQVKGCCAHGTAIMADIPMLLESKLAFKNLMEYIGTDTGGTITYQ